MPTFVFYTLKQSDPANAVCGTARERGTPGGSRQMSADPSHALIEGWWGVGLIRGVSMPEAAPNSHSSPDLSVGLPHIKHLYEESE